MADEVLFMRCWKCSAVVPETVEYCSACGARQASRRGNRRFALLGIAVTGLVGCTALIYTSGTKGNSAGAPATRRGPRIGDDASLTRTTACGSTQEALDEMTKWITRNDSPEALRVMGRTHSILVEKGMQAKVIDGTMFTRKIRILTNTSGESMLRDEQGAFVADPRIGKECWLPFEALE